MEPFVLGFRLRQVERLLATLTELLDRSNGASLFGGR